MYWGRYVGTGGPEGYDVSPWSQEVVACVHRPAPSVGLWGYWLFGAGGHCSAKGCLLVWKGKPTGRLPPSDNATTDIAHHAAKKAVQARRITQSLWHCRGWAGWRQAWKACGVAGALTSGKNLQAKRSMSQWSAYCARGAHVGRKLQKGGGPFKTCIGARNAHRCKVRAPRPS